MPDTYSIGALAKATDTKVETVRYYERIGLLPEPTRTRGNYRVYAADDVARLSFIRRARRLGFTIEQIRDLLELANRSGADCGGVDAIAKEHLGEIDRKIADLTSLRRELSDLVAQCRRGAIADCRIIAALSTTE